MAFTVDGSDPGQPGQSCQDCRQDAVVLSVLDARRGVTA